ncbi:hypothetical protein BDR22DRAFT_874171 [Usnea florida]
MSSSTSTDQPDRKSPAYFAHRPRLIGPSTSGPAKKSRHSPDPLKNHKHSAVDRLASVFGSRIEKKRTSHRTHNANSSTAATTFTDLIRVFIKNRLGTRTEILCSPSDSIGAFKKLAAVYVGTRPEAMLFKRQGERPFRDFLTLEDYGISNGSSLDLEVDTGDE